MKKIVWIVLICIFAAQAVFWIVFGLLALSNGQQNTFISLLMIADGAVFGLLALLCKKEHLFIKIITLIFLFVNTVLTVTDQMGAIDIAVLVLNIIALLGCLYLFISGRSSRRTR